MACHCNTPEALHVAPAVFCTPGIACCNAILLWCAASQEARCSLEEHIRDRAAADLAATRWADCELTTADLLAADRLLKPMHCCILLMI